MERPGFCARDALSVKARDQVRTSLLASTADKDLSLGRRAMLSLKTATRSGTRSRMTMNSMLTAGSVPLNTFH